MQNILNLYFPAIRSLEVIAEEILADEALTRVFNEWCPEKRMYFVDICTGRRGVKMLYEPFLQDIVHCSVVKKTMGAWLGNLTGQEVTVKEVFMDDSEDIVLMECIVELHRTGEQRSIRFIGQEFFSPDWELPYHKEDLYTVIVLKNSPDEFQLHRRAYMYYGCRQNDQKAAGAYPGEYCVFCPAQFEKYIRDTGIRSLMDAWWAFLVCDEPEVIAQIVIKQPTFVEIYGKLYELLGQTERTIQLMQGSRPHTDCGIKCAWMIKVEKMLEDQKRQNISQAEKLASMQEVIEKQSYIISEQCRETTDDAEKINGQNFKKG